MMNWRCHARSAFPEEALSFALFLTNATQPGPLCRGSPGGCLRSGALAKIEQGLRHSLATRQEEPGASAGCKSPQTLEIGEGAGAASPGVKRLPSILLQAAATGVFGSRAAMKAGWLAREREWEQLCVGRWP